MKISDEQPANVQYQRFDVAPTEQGAVYLSGDREVFFLSDKTTEQDFYHNLSHVQRVVAAARFRAWADMAEAAGDYSDPA